MRKFEGKVAVVTGAASGMGLAFAERFASEGMKVVLADVEERALAATVQRFKELGVVPKQVIDRERAVPTGCG
jgi:NAD(P)-dependent dehydrogenase (short-subunit alcohol dehydrogenase family)